MPLVLFLVTLHSIKLFWVKVTTKDLVASLVLQISAVGLFVAPGTAASSISPRGTRRKNPISKFKNKPMYSCCQLANYIYIYMLIRFHPCGTFNVWMLSFLEDTGHCKLYPIKLGKVFTRITTLQLHLLQTLTNCRSSWSSAIGVNDALLKPISATGASKCQ